MFISVNFMSEPSSSHYLNNGALKKSEQAVAAAARAVNHHERLQLQLTCDEKCQAVQ